MKMDSSPPIFARRRSRSPLPFTPTTWRPTGDWAGAVHHGSGAGSGSGGGKRRVRSRRAGGSGTGCSVAMPTARACVNSGKTRRPHNRCARPLGRARARRMGSWVEGAGARTEYAERLARRGG